MSIGLSYGAKPEPAEPVRAPTLYLDADVESTIRRVVLDSAGLVEVGGWLAGPGAASIAYLATPPGPEDRCGPRCFTHVYDGRLANRLGDRGLTITGIWHSHPPQSEAKLSDPDLLAGGKMLRELELGTIASVVAIPDAEFNVALHAWLLTLRPGDEMLVERADVRVIAPLPITTLSWKDLQRRREALRAKGA
jgi:hypothetical protein